MDSSRTSLLPGASSSSHKSIYSDDPSSSRTSLLAGVSSSSHQSTYSDDSSDYDEQHTSRRRHHRPHLHIGHHRKRSRSRSRTPQPSVQEIGMSVSSPSPEGGKTLSGHIQDKLFSKVLQTVVPSDYDMHKYAEMSEKGDKRKDKDRPQFSLTLMSGNFRKFNARVGVVFVFQHRLFRILTWNHPTHTFSAMAVYSFVCLDPQLLAVLPVAVILLFIMIPAFIARHPPAPNVGVPPKGGKVEVYNAHGAPVAPPPEVKAVTEMSKDFFRNLRDLQNTMSDFSEAHDQIIATIGPPTNFSNEQISSGVFQLLFAICCGLFVFAYLIPWNIVFLVWGWSAIALFHPTIQDWLLSAPDSEFAEREKKRAISGFKSWVEKDIVIDETPEIREVEIFELQKHASQSWEWEHWIYTASPYEPLSPARISGQRPKGTRFFEDVRPPPGWEWWDKKWVLDLGSREWVAERCITGVEVDENKERWVYDVVEGEESDDDDDDHARNIVATGGGEDVSMGVGKRKKRVKRRGDWRRRRWVRSVVRKKWGNE